MFKEIKLNIDYLDEGHISAVKNCTLDLFQVELEDIEVVNFKNNVYEVKLAKSQGIFTIPYSDIQYLDVEFPDCAIIRGERVEFNSIVQFEKALNKLHKEVGGQDIESHIIFPTMTYKDVILLHQYLSGRKLPIGGYRLMG